MKILNIDKLIFPEVRVIKFHRFLDHRGYFTETFRRSDLDSIEDGTLFKDVSFVQMNESYSKKGTVRGLHFQWNPYMGKLIRSSEGTMIDMILDIRKGSDNFGKIIMHELSADTDANQAEWLWVPPGFAHGFFALSDCMVEYFCSSEYNPDCESGISPMAHDIDWSLCDQSLRGEFTKITKGKELLISDKDRDGHSLKSWQDGSESENFVLEI